MIKRIQTFLTSLFSAAVLAVPLLAPAAVSAQNSQIQQGVCGGAQNLQIDSQASCTDPGATDKVNNIITTVINIFSVIVGIIAVIMIIIGGLKYITSGGASDNVSSAKNTILYAIIGLIIVALAQILVRFVLNKATQ
jgi:hypothetical protein